ncbi:MAG: hypothetical protein PVF87_01310 [Acidimicrobiia bacterium]|jgi:hypothetical protein
MVASNTDEIHAVCSGQRIAAFEYLGFIRLTGGSGRYADVSGSLLAIATLEPTTGQVSIRGWGWMIPWESPHSTPVAEIQPLTQTRARSVSGPESIG